LKTNKDPDLLTVTTIIIFD